MAIDPAAQFTARIGLAQGKHPQTPVLSQTESTGNGTALPSFIETDFGSQRDNGLTAVIIGAPYTGTADAAPVEIDSESLIALYERCGTDCTSQLHGKWALLLVDPQQGRILLASDRMGRVPVYYGMEPDGLVVGTDLSRVRTLMGITTLCAQNLYNYVYFHMVPAPGSIWEGIQKLRASEQMEFTSERWQHKRYWTPRFIEKRCQAIGSQHQVLRDQLRAAVSRCRPADGKVGAFLSGGLDSSTVAGMLSELQGDTCDAYAIGFDAEGYDEMPYARLVAEHFGVRLHEYYVTPDDVVAALPTVAASFDEPFGNSSALPAYFCARMAAANGITTMLAGDGGDELFAGNERYAKQRVFEPYNRLPEWLRSSVLEPLAQHLPTKVPLASKIKSYITQAKLPLPDRLHHYSFLEQINPQEVFRESVLRRVVTEEPMRLLRETYGNPAGASDLNRMLFLDWQVTLADNDLRKVDQACRLANVKVRYPMLDDELVQFSTTLPSDWKMPGKRLRDFYKQSLTGWLPAATISKSKHGFGLPFGVWMRHHKPLQELAYEHILLLKQRRIFSHDFLETTISRHRDGHASYFGELIWILTALEIWIDKHQPGYCHE